MAKGKSITHGMDEICKMGIRVAKDTALAIQEHIRADPNSALEQTLRGKRKKKCLVIDSVAEMDCRKAIGTADGGKFKKWEFHGEEKLRDRNLDLSKKKTVCVLADAVDGTDLLERGLSNWCSCLVFFDPRKRRGRQLVASFVALPNGEVYHARCDKKGAFVTARDGTVGPVAGPSNVKRLADASICFYGQKLRNLKATVTTLFIERLEKALVKTVRDVRKADLRIYNLAGIPMMMKLIDHRTKEARTIDGVFDIEGQMPHDVVPGAFIAMKGGATIKTIDGSDLSFAELEELLLKPAASELKYVLASTEALANAIVQVVSEMGRGT
jgi:fructose-1,6-bisphosphatase/inositol monophosphatase family enzyme